MRRILVPVSLAFLAPQISVAQTASPAPQAPPPPACTAPEHRQFDFWLGHWDVYRTGTDQLVGKNHIEKLYGDCAIRENWKPLGGPGGGSLNTYQADEKLWRQTWVDSGNSHADFKGGMSGGKMVIAGQWKGVNGPGTDGYVRMTYTKLPDGSVRQFGEVSSDEGKTFAPSFDFTYRPSKSATVNTTS